MRFICKACDCILALFPLSDTYMVSVVLTVLLYWFKQAGKAAIATGGIKQSGRMHHFLLFFALKSPISLNTKSKASIQFTNKGSVLEWLEHLGSSRLTILTQPQGAFGPVSLSPATSRVCCAECRMHCLSFLEEGQDEDGARKKKL